MIKLSSLVEAKFSWMISHWLAFCHFCLSPYLAGFLNVIFIFIKKLLLNYINSLKKGAIQKKN